VVAAVAAQPRREPCYREVRHPKRLPSLAYYRYMHAKRAFVLCCLRRAQRGFAPGMRLAQVESRPFVTPNQAFGVPPGHTRALNELAKGER
jgi:hypothetical protein